MKEENETIILVNDADRADGYFRFSTSKEAVWKRVCRRIGGEAMVTDVRRSLKGHLCTNWQGKIPIRFLSSTLGIRKAGAKKRTITKQQFKKKVQS